MGANRGASSRPLPVLLACVAIGAAHQSHGAQARESMSFAGSASIGTAQSGAPAIDAHSPLPTHKLVRRTLQADPKQVYFVYVPSSGGRGAPLFVTVHGISRNAEEHATLFSDFAEAYAVVLVAPYFTESQNDDYQRLGRVGRGTRADLVLDSIIAEVAASTGAAAEKIYLFGFSGGAQFAHRYAMAHPERVARAVIGAAGWYTFPDDRTPYPYGIGPSRELPSVRFDPEQFLRVPIAVFVGEQDITNESLRRNAEVDRQQGVTRFERARNWVAAMRAAAEARHLEPLVSYEPVAGIHHSFEQFMRQGRLGERVFEALFGPPSPRKPRADDDPAPSEQRSGSRQLAADPIGVTEAAPLLVCLGWR
jgi:pimeloyl-ACP methyl ester carboxylesterase